MDPRRRAPAAALSTAAVLPAAWGDAPRRIERKDRAVASRPTHGAVRADLELVFRADYPRVVSVAARVLGSRDDAEVYAAAVIAAHGEPDPDDPVLTRVGGEFTTEAFDADRVEARQAQQSGREEP